MACISKFSTSTLGILLMLVLTTAIHANAQVENVPVYHPVYQFLKRMETKGIIGRYHDAILPLSRKEVTTFLDSVSVDQEKLTAVERGMLDEFAVEFEFDRSRTTANAFEGLDFTDHSVPGAVGGLFSDKEKYLYKYSDSSVTMFVNGLLTIDGRRSRGDAIAGENAEFMQFGGRIRGMIGSSIGYYLDATNAQFWGSRKVLGRDKFISQSYTLGITDAQNFDQAEGYLRYDQGVMSAQIGRERLLWGNGYGDKLIVSDNTKVFDFIRMDAQYKSLKYTFLHSWLSGQKTALFFSLPFDSTTIFDEPVAPDKYFAAHRLEVSASNSLDLGFQEMVIYSNRAPDLAYLNPVTLIESAQRSREERDNVLWAFDAQWRPILNWELQGTIDFDDLAFSKWGTNDVQNKDAWQVGVRGVDPIGIANVTIEAEYTHIEPYTFSHSRSRDNSYTNDGRTMTHHIGPNSESWYFQLDNLWTRRIRTTVSFERINHGADILSNTGQLITNVGGNILIPIRPTDPTQKDWLGGDLQHSSLVNVNATWEMWKEVFLEGHYYFQRMNSELTGNVQENHDFGVALRIDY